MPVPPKTFQSDDTVLDLAIKKHIASLYEAVDNKDLEKWGSHFTEDAELKKGTSNVKGRASASPHFRTEFVLIVGLLVDFY
jgi:ketosteroid isomerase-like protein